MNPKLLQKISYGMYVVSSKSNEKLNGQIANSIIQISSEPATVAVSINKLNLTHECINQSGLFSISVLLEETPMPFIGKFGFKSGRDINKFDGVNYKTGVTGVPIVLDYSIGYIEAELINKIDVETHTLFIGKIVDAEIIGDGTPMTYDYYHKVKKGLSPKTAPTFINTKNNKEEKEMKKYVCTVCGYVYDPEVGDPDSGIAPGTDFKDIPDDWSCPVCGVTKDQFEEEK